MRRVGLLCLLALPVILSPAVADDPDKAKLLKATLALQELMQKAIDDAEPSIGCILVCSVRPAAIGGPMSLWQ